MSNWLFICSVSVFLEIFHISLTSQWIHSPWKMNDDSVGSVGTDFSFILASNSSSIDCDADIEIFSFFLSIGSVATFMLAWSDRINRGWEGGGGWTAFFLFIYQQCSLLQLHISSPRENKTIHRCQRRHPHWSWAWNQTNNCPAYAISCPSDYEFDDTNMWFIVHRRIQFDTCTYRNVVLYSGI